MKSELQNISFYLLFLCNQAIPLTQLIKLGVKPALVCFQLLQAQPGAALGCFVIIEVGEVDGWLNRCQCAHEIVSVRQLV